MLKQELAEMVAAHDLELGVPDSLERRTKMWMREPAYYLSALLEWRTAPESEKPAAKKALDAARDRRFQAGPGGRATRARQSGRIAR